MEHGGGMNNVMLEPVRTIIARRLAAKAKAEQGGDYPLPYDVQFHARADADRHLPRRVYSLQVMWQGKSYSEEDGLRFWEAARQELEKRLRVVQRQTHEPSEQQWAEEQQRIEQAYIEARQRLDGIAKAMMVETDGRDVAQLRNDLQQALGQQRQLHLQRIGVQARRRAIEARIDELREVAGKVVEDDPILREMQALVEIQEQRLAIMRTDSPDIRKFREIVATLHRQIDDYLRLQKEDWDREQDVKFQQLQQVLRDEEVRLADWSAKAAREEPATPDYQLAKSQLVEARIALLKAQRDAAERAQGTVLAELNNELSTLIVEAAELDEKSKALKELVAQLGGQASPRKVADVELLQAELRDAQVAVGNARQTMLAHAAQPRPTLEQITIRPLEEALFGDDAEAADPQP